MQTLKALAFFIIIFFVEALALVFQHNIPLISQLQDARPFIFPMILAYGCLALPFGLTLALAFITGLSWDALTTQFHFVTIAGHTRPAVEISFAWAIVLYALICLFIHGLRPLFLRGRWDVYCVASGLCTAAILSAEYLLITFHRGGLVFSTALLPRIFWPSLLNTLVAPLVFVAFNVIAGVLNYSIYDPDDVLPT